MEKPDITIQTKVGDILNHYPELEEVLLGMSPSFVKLKNPILRRTVAKVASLKQAAEIGNVDLATLITTLRKAAGLSLSEVNDSEDDNTNSEKPEWVNEDSVVETFDACPIINSGGSPMLDILAKADSLSNGQILKLSTPFVPAPILEILKSKGYKHWGCKTELIVDTYILKQ